MEFLAGIIVGILLGAPVGVLLMGIAVANIRAQESSERGEANSDFIVAIAFYFLVGLIILGMWLLSGWDLPL